MSNIIEDKDYILVNIENAKFNVEGILEKMLDKSYLKYKIFNNRFTIFFKDGGFFGHGLSELIKYAENDGTWYSNTWNCILGTEPYTGRLRSLYYDEFVFLLSEDLIQFDDFELLTSDDIWKNFDNYIEAKETPFLKSLMDCKNKADLRKEYRKLVMEYHPDKTGSDNEQIRQITATYLRLVKQVNSLKTF